MPRETARKVLEIESHAILDLRDRIDASFDRAVEILLACPGRVVVTGMGKSGLIGQKISATFSSTGTPSLFLHPAEAIHGDLGRIVKGDVVLAMSHSGNTQELLALLPSVTLDDGYGGPTRGEAGVPREEEAALQSGPGLAPRIPVVLRLAVERARRRQQSGTGTNCQRIGTRRQSRAGRA